MEGEEEISKRASMWNVPQHLPHRMLWCAWSIRRVERRQCWSLHFDSFVRGKGCLVPEVEGGLIIHLWCGVVCAGVSDAGVSEGASAGVSAGVSACM